MLEFRRVLLDRKSTRLNSSHTIISYAVFCLKKKSRERKTGDTIRAYACSWRESRVTHDRGAYTCRRCSRGSRGTLFASSSLIFFFLEGRPPRLTSFSPIGCFLMP